MVLGKHGDSNSEEESLLQKDHKTVNVESRSKSHDRSGAESSNQNGSTFGSSYEHEWPKYQDSYGACDEDLSAPEDHVDSKIYYNAETSRVKLRSPVSFIGPRSASPSNSLHSNVSGPEYLSATEDHGETDSKAFKNRGRSRVRLRSPILFKAVGSVSPTPSQHSTISQYERTLQAETSNSELEEGQQNDLYEEKEKVKPEQDDDEEPVDCTQPTKSFSFRALSRAQKMTLISFALADFGTFLCLSLIAPFFPKEARTKGVNDTISGWIFGVYALTQFFTAPFFGKLVPYAGIKFMYNSGLFLAGGCTVLFGFLTYVPVDDGGTVFVVLCFVIRIILALGCTANQTACYSLVAQMFPENIGTVFGMGEVFVGLGFMSGPPIGGALYGFGGFQLPFFVTGGIILLTVPMNFWIIPSSNEVVKKNEGPSIFKMFKSLSTVNNCLSVIVAATVWSILDPTLEPHLSTFNLGPEIIGLLFLLMAAFYAISSPFWGWVGDKVPDNKVVLIPGFLAAGVGMLFIGPSQILGFDEDYSELWMNIVCLVILGVAGSAALIPTFDIFLITAEKLGFEDDMHTYGMVAGLWSSMYAFGDFLGPAVGGFLLDIVGFSWCTTYTAFACFVMAGMLILTMLCESKCCKSCNVCSCCYGTNKQKMNAKSNSIATENTPLLTDRVEVSRDFLNGDLLSSYPPRSLTESV